MDGTELKYDLLDNLEKREVQDFIDFLLSKRKKFQTERSETYKTKIQSVSVWNDTDFRFFAENNQLFSQWKPSEW
jgi:hypothetical protein